MIYIVIVYNLNTRKVFFRDGFSNIADAREVFQSILKEGSKFIMHEFRDDAEFIHLNGNVMTMEILPL